MVWIVGEGSSPDEIDAFETRLIQKLRGPSQNGKGIVLTGDVSAVTLDRADHNDNTEQDVLEEIASMFKIPLAKLRSTSATFNNSTQADYAWLRDGIQPLCRQF